MTRPTIEPLPVAEAATAEQDFQDRVRQHIDQQKAPTRSMLQSTGYKFFNKYDSRWMEDESTAFLQDGHLTPTRSDT